MPVSKRRKKAAHPVKRREPSVTLAGKSFVIRPITLGPLRDLTAAGNVQAITAYQAAGLSGDTVTPDMEAKALDGMVAVISTSLGVAPEFIWEHVNLMEASALCAAIYLRSGLIQQGDDPKAKAAS